MTSWIRQRIAFILAMLLALAITFGGPETRASRPEDCSIFLDKSRLLKEQDQRVIERFIGHAKTFAENLSDASVAAALEEKGPERFCWVDFRYLNCLNIAFQLTGDDAYLDLFREAFGHYEQALSRGEDQFLGWYGKTIESRQKKENPDLKVDELQTNFRAIGILSTWIELARSRSDYAANNLVTIEGYLELIEQHLFPKWDVRGHFAIIPGRGGVYRALDFPRTIEVSLSFEKLSIIVEALLKLHRVTENDVYLKRALQVGAWYKSHLTPRDGHYEWMSWVPSGPWDVHPAKEDSWTVSWMGPDPNGGWYVAALSIALNFYQHGLLFDREDLDRFIRTQKEMCWNGDMENPVYRKVTGEKDKWTHGRFLSYQLSHYDPLLTKLAFDGPHEPQILRDSEDAWKGGANAQDYVIEKYLMAPRIEDTPQPFESIGRKFLSNEDNQVFHDILNRGVCEPGSIPARKPSDLFALPHARGSSER